MSTLFLWKDPLVFYLFCMSYYPYHLFLVFFVLNVNTWVKWGKEHNPELEPGYLKILLKFPGWERTEWAKRLGRKRGIPALRDSCEIWVPPHTLTGTTATVDLFTIQGIVYSRPELKALWHYTIQVPTNLCLGDTDKETPRKIKYLAQYLTCIFWQNRKLVGLFLRPISLSSSFTRSSFSANL